MRDRLVRLGAIFGLVAAAGCADGGSSTDAAADAGADEIDGAGDVVPDAEADASVEADADEEADSVVEAEADAAPDGEPEADAEAEAEPDVGPEADAEAEADGLPSPAPECTDSSACSLFTDCCNCLALAPGESPPPCGITECFVTTCTPRGITGEDVTCAAGRCAAGYDCDSSTVICATPPPLCPAGEVPSVMGSCWGACVPATECAYVRDCTDCEPALQFCVRYVTRLGLVAHCVERLDECGAAPECACAAASVCVGAFDLCGDDPAGPTCSCPTCG